MISTENLPPILDYPNWILIYSLDNTTGDKNLEYQKLLQNINIFTNNKFSKMQIYLYGDNSLYEFAVQNNINYLSNGTAIISIIQKLMTNGKSIILLKNYTMPCSCFFTFIKNNDAIFAADIDNDNYFLLSEKMGLEKIIDDQIMILPNTPENINFITKTNNIAQKLNTNLDTAGKISLSHLNQKMHLIQNIDNANILEYQNYNEISKKLIHDSKEKIGLTDMIPYNHPDYIYYPFLDIDSTKDVAIPNPQYFNTNGYGSEIPFDKSKLFLRFNDKNKGIFIKKKMGNVIVPALLHHVWLHDAPDIIYQRAWSKILHQPWAYLVWTENNINPPPRWKYLWENTADPNMKYIIAAMILLEKYGGVIVDSYSMPLKIIPEELLMSKFAAAFQNEPINGTLISYKFMAGSQNSPIVNKIHAILMSDKNDNKLNMIQNDILSDPDTVIYPSYFFNPRLATTPKILMDQAVAIHFKKIIPMTKHTKTPLQRNYIVTPDAIMAKLNENPRDNIN